MKLRAQFTKHHLSRFLGHLDLQRTMERSLRRAGLPVAYSQGFSPHPRISFASALATGTSSEGEFVDVELSAAIAPADFMARANGCLPTGLSFLDVRQAPGDGDSLFSLINAAEYRLTFAVPAAAAAEMLAGAIGTFMARDVVEVEKEGKRGSRVVNIREQTYALDVETVLPEPGTPGAVVNVRALLASGSQGSLKPETLLEGFRQVEPALEGVALVNTHRLMIYRRAPESGQLVEPWGL
ncbi:MAG TPA: TIGR03936 family radical SAM-associated protein [Symbiobacteriaceae bacterium]|nr:TIGR03936 family radical SAM-associated protein [Symbiobacteriaceae bacterium]